MTLPTLLLHADAQHGVALYAQRLADAVRSTVGQVLTLLDSGAHRRDIRPVHVHFTDRLWGDSAGEAASRFERLSALGPTTVTLHDLPQASDGVGRDARAAAYRRVVAAATRVVVNSRHEAALLREIGATSRVAPIVIPLPVDPDPPTAASARRRTAAVLGFFYPGKGHDAVIEAVARASRDPLAVEALGRPSPGHEREAAALQRRAAELGTSFSLSGYLSDADLLERCRAAGVPVVAHAHFSASGSVNSWIASGRRPIAIDSGYTREVAALRPGTLTLVDADGLANAIDEAWNDPASTWIADTATTRPDLADTAAEYIRLWRDVHG